MMASWGGIHPQMELRPLAGHKDKGGGGLRLADLGEEAELDPPPVEPVAQGRNRFGPPIARRCIREQTRL